MMFLVYNSRAENTRITSFILDTVVDWAYRGATRREKLYSVVTLKRRFLSLLALLQCFNRFAASVVSGAHTIQLDSNVGEQLVNFFSRWYIRKCASCAAFAIHRAVYFIQTLEAMFAASITAKNGALFSPSLLQKHFTTPKRWCLKCSFCDVWTGRRRSRVLKSLHSNVNMNGQDSASTTKKKNSHLVHESSIPWPLNVEPVTPTLASSYFHTNCRKCL